LLAPEAATNVLMTDQLDYVPERITIRMGETVKWENTSGLIHTVTADPGKAIDPSHASVPDGADTFDSGTIPPGRTFSYTFRVPGTYRYFSIPYEAAGMVGVVEVQPR
jgi:plastocyanin